MFHKLETEKEYNNLRTIIYGLEPLSGVKKNCQCYLPTIGLERIEYLIHFTSRIQKNLIALHRYRF